MKYCDESLNAIEEIKERYRNSIGKRIIVKDNLSFCNQSKYQKPVKYIGIIESCHREFFIVRRESGVRITYQYKDVYISDNNEHLGFAIL